MIFWPCVKQTAPLLWLKTSATRQVANLVLLNSDFNDVPEILFEGRRVVNNIARIAPIFLSKTTYSFILTIICISSILLGQAEWLLVFIYPHSNHLD